MAKSTKSARVYKKTHKKLSIIGQKYGTSVPIIIDKLVENIATTDQLDSLFSYSKPKRKSKWSDF